MHAIIVGGGPVAGALARRLTDCHHQVSLVIDAPSLAEDMACRFPKSLVIQGSGSDGHALQDARASQADMLFAVDEDDSRNMVACLIAKQRFSIKHVVALASACEDKPAFSALEIVSICAPDVVVDALVGDLQVG